MRTLVGVGVVSCTNADLAVAEVIRDVAPDGESSIDRLYPLTSWTPTPTELEALFLQARINPGELAALPAPRQKIDAIHAADVRSEDRLTFIAVSVTSTCVVVPRPARMIIQAAGPNRGDAVSWQFGNP